MIERVECKIFILLEKIKEKHFLSNIQFGIFQNYQILECKIV